jgi:arabinofuranan 3-O-arabinosyltransferase
MTSLPSTQPADRGYNLLVIAWSLFAVWVLVRYGIRLGLLLHAELGLNMDTNIVDRDFANYWVGGKLALNGGYALLFDPPAYYAYLQSLFGENYQIHAWSYPPHFLPLVAPLGLMEYRPALAVFLVVTLALFTWAAWEFMRRYATGVSKPLVALALAGYVFMQIEATQNGFLTGALLLATFAFMRERPMLAGLFLALLTIKPHLGFLIPLIAIVDRNWKLLGWATGFTLGLLGLSIALFGLDVWRLYFSQIVPYQNFVMTDWSGIFLRMMPSAFGSIRTLGFTPSTAFAVQAVVSLAALVVLKPLLFTLRDPLERAFAILAGTLLVTPYAFNYDMGAVSVVAACLALRARDEHRHAAMWIYGGLAMLPAVMTPLGLKMLPVSPLILAAAFAVLWVGMRRSVAAAR